MHQNLSMISGDKVTSSFGKGFITESDQMKAICENPDAWQYNRLWAQPQTNPLLPGNPVEGGICKKFGKRFLIMMVI